MALTVEKRQVNLRAIEVVVYAISELVVVSSLVFYSILGCNFPIFQQLINCFIYIVVFLRCIMISNDNVNCFKF